MYTQSWTWVHLTDPIMGEASGWQGGGAAAPCALCPLPGFPPSRREKNYICPIDPSRPLLQRKFM